MKWLEKIRSLIPELIKWIEKAEQFTHLPGSEKKEFVIDAIMAEFNIKWLPDSIESRVWSLLIDAIVDVINKYVWKKED